MAIVSRAKYVVMSYFLYEISFNYLQKYKLFNCISCHSHAVSRNKENSRQDD